MKPNFHHKLLFILLLLLSVSVGKTFAQDSTAASTILDLKYFLPENKVPYIKVITKKKLGRKFEPVTGITVNIYLGSVAPNNMLGKITTASNGEGKIAFPPSLKATWDSLDAFTIVAESVPGGKEELLSAELPIKKAILIIDTVNTDGIRNVTGVLKEKKGNSWVVAAAVEMKLRIKRALGNLTLGDAETYTSDSSGVAMAGFIKDSMPGDEKGNIILVAVVEDNDSYGNLVAEKMVPWGRPQVAESPFWRRTLWSTGNRAPIWLLFIAFSILLGVWGTVIYLVTQVIKIRKMGKLVDKKIAV